MIKRLIFVTLLCVLPIIPSINAQENAPFRVYLTFEDGPTDAYTPHILDILAVHNAKATFLINGYQINGHEDLLQREVREGHALINHLWEEPGVYAGATDEDVIASYLRTEEAIRTALGDAAPIYDAQVKMFWQPGGGVKPFPSSAGIDVITYNWHVDSDDCGWGLPDSINLDSLEFDAAVIENVLGEPVSEGKFHNPYNVFDYGDGVIIAFHDINRVTGRVLPTILSELQAAGATFETLPRPWDEVGTMPVVIGLPPQMGTGVAGYAVPATVRVESIIRAAPSTGARIQSIVMEGTQLTATGRTDGWWIQVQHDGNTGWVYRPLLDIRGAIPNLPYVG